MAMCIKSIARTSFNLLNRNVFQQLTSIATRQLYTPLSLGINGYLNARTHVKTQFTNVDNLFFNKMNDLMEKSESMVFTEDLKIMLHLVEKKPELLDLLYKMIVKYHSQNNLRFGSFVFGTVVMRALYHLDEPDLALKAFKDPQLQNFFDQLMSQQILMDLLYNHRRYDDMKEIYDIIKNTNLNGVVHPKNPFILIMGACYQQNTKESLDYAVNLFKEVKIRGYEFPRRSISFLAALALRQNDPEIALEVTSLIRKVRYIDIRCIRLEAYALLKRFEEVMIYFRNTVQDDLLGKNKQCYFKDTIERVEALILKENFDENSEVMKLLKQIKLHNYIQDNLFDEHITSTIDHIKGSYQNKQIGQNFKYRDMHQAHKKNSFGNETHYNNISPRLEDTA